MTAAALALMVYASTECPHGPPCQDPRDNCRTSIQGIPRLHFRPNWEWDHAACPLAKPGVTAGAREDLQFYMRQGTAGGAWKTDFEGGDTCLPSDLVCAPDAADAPGDAPLVCGLMDPPPPPPPGTDSSGGSTCTADCGAACMWNNVPQADGSVGDGTLYTYRHLRNYKDEPCMVAKNDIRFTNANIDFVVVRHVSPSAPSARHPSPPPAHRVRPRLAGE